MAQFELVRDEIANAGACVVYIAAEKRAGFFKPENFFARRHISFPFLLDEERSITKAWGVYNRLAIDAYNIAKPATFVVGRDGVVKYAYVGKNQHDRAPMDEVLAAMRG